MPQERTSVYESKGPSAEPNFSELQELLIGEYVRDLHDHRTRIGKLEESERNGSLEVAKSLVQAAKTDPKIKKVLYPVIEDALRVSVDQNPSLMAGVLFPIVGEAVRKAVSHAMQQVMDSTNELLTNSLSMERLKWRFEAWRSGKSFAEVALSHSLSFRVEHIYVIHRATGLLLGQMSNQSDLLQDSDMVVGMLTAIQDFVRDSFTSEKKSDLDVIQISEFKIWLQHGPIALLAAVISGQPKPALREVLERQVEDIHRQFQVGMKNFETTGQSIPGIEDGLAGCMVEEVQEKKKEPQSYTKFKVAGWILLALSCIATVYYVRRAVLWSNYLNRLRHQSGIVVIDDTSTWRGLSVRGLRDPLAIDPESILDKYHLSPANVSEHWEAYYSLDPRFESARRLNSEADALRKSALRFELDSTLLPVDQLAVLNTIGIEAQELVADAKRQGRYIHIQVLGHTDSVGTSQHNDMLSQYRAETIVRFLISRGVDANLLSSAGVRDTQLEYSQFKQYSPEGSDLDRRVTFSVDLR